MASVTKPRNLTHAQFDSMQSIDDLRKLADKVLKKFDLEVSKSEIASFNPLEVDVLYFMLGVYIVEHKDHWLLGTVGGN